MTTVAPIDLAALHQGAARSIARVETRDTYAPESPDYQAWLRGEPRPDRSVRTSDYLRRVAAATLRGVEWERLRVITDPPTRYEAWELTAYVESQAAGELVTIAPRTAVPDARTDVWLVDDVAVVQEYDVLGAFTGRRWATPDEHDHALRVADAIRAHGAALNVYLAGGVPAARRAS